VKIHATFANLKHNTRAELKTKIVATNRRAKGVLATKCKNVCENK